MNLLLTSDGLSTPAINDALLSLLQKSPQECSALVLAYIETEQSFAYSLEARQELIDLGVRDAIVFNLTDDAFTLTDTYDIIYVCGGNTFRILDRMKKTGVFEFVNKEMKKEHAVYIGVSAGSIIAGPTIEIAGHGSSGDPNDINLVDVTSLHLTDTTILPHFNPLLLSEADEFQKKTIYPVQTLKDGEALVISNDGTQTLITQ